MNKSRNQNSILFLATLGVYLGLFIAGGAAPQVFAHSATTRGFEISDEIEVKDDLDNKPGDCDEKLAIANSKSASYGGRSDALTDYGQIVLRLVAASLQSKLESYSFGPFSYFEDQSRPTFVSNYSGKPVRFPKGTRGEIDKSITDLVGIVPLIESSETTGIAFDLSIDAVSVGSSLAFNRLDRYEAQRLFVSLRTSLDLANCRVASPAEKLVLDNTDIRQSDSVIRITTRLPRAGLDTLLAKNAK